MPPDMPPIVNRYEIGSVPASVTRVGLVTTGGAKPPKGWRETSGAIHLGGGRWLVPLEREADDAT